MQRAIVLVLVAACACSRGRTAKPLTGPIKLDVYWFGAFPETTQVDTEDFAAGLYDAGYFAPLKSIGADPQFMEGRPAALHAEVNISAVPVPNTHNQCAWHEWKVDHPAIYIVEGCSQWQLTEALSHELVETAADPHVDDADLELADQCQNTGGADFVVSGRLRKVARYMADGKCFPP